MRSTCLRHLILPIQLLSGCILPAALQQEVPDGGLLLEVVSSEPSFGPLKAVNPSQTYKDIRIDVFSDSSAVAGRLFIQKNGLCCDLDNPDHAVIEHNQNADTMKLESDIGPYPHYTLVFRQPVQPCGAVPPTKVAYLIPVIASQGFSDQQGDAVSASTGLGFVDKTHFWSVQCP